MITPIEFCEKFKPCPEGLVFVQKHETLAEAWEKCNRSDWMLWSLERIEHPRDHKKLRLFAIWCAKNTPMKDGRTTGKLITDPRSIAALDVAERFATGNATDAEMDAAWDAAWTAARDAAWGAARDAAAAAAWTAARDAAWGAARDAAADAARAAALAAAWTAAWGAARAAAWDAAADAALAAQANQFRTMIRNPFI
jgi:hypothetical protein